MKVYVFRTGRCYHRQFKCKAVMWWHWDSANEVGLTGAKHAGYSPCFRCCFEEHAARGAKK